MTFLKTLFARIWAVWGLIWFFVTLLPFYPFFLICYYFVPDPKRTKLFISASRIWMGIYLPMIGCPLSVKGKEYFKKGQNYVVVCNHNSFMDIPVTSPGIPGTNKTIGKKEFAKTPLFGVAYKIGSVLIDRKSEQNRRESYIKMKQVLEMGLHMCIYPEGTRNKTNEPLRPFHDGAFKLASETGKPIMPGIIFNTKVALPADKGFYLWPVKLKMHFLPPVNVEKGEPVKELKEKVFAMMKTYIENNQ